MHDEEKRTEFREKLSGYVKVYAFLSQIIPYADPELEMLYSYGRFLLPHLPMDRDGESSSSAMMSHCNIIGWNVFSPAPSRSKKAKPQ